MPEYYLGIDVGFTNSGATTGLCLITVEQNCLRWECRNSTTDEGERLQDLNSLITDPQVLNGAGIDGPLHPEGEPLTHYRAAEALLTGGTNYVFKTRCQPARTPNCQDLHRHARALAHLVLERQPAARIVEAFPDAFLAFLLADADFQNLPDGEPGGKKSDRYWQAAVTNSYLQALIGHLGLALQPAQPLDSIMDTDRRAAFVCALTALCVSRGKYVAVGDPTYGDFHLPPAEVWGREANGHTRWAETPLQNKVDSVHKRLTHQSHRDARVDPQQRP